MIRPACGPISVYVLLAAGWLLAAQLPASAFADSPEGTLVTSEASVDLFKVWPEIAQAPKAGLATIECLIRPDVAAIDRPRSFVITLSNRRGSDVAGLSLTMKQGALRANVFGTSLTSDKSLVPERWTHVALTINTKTINKQARLWIDGKLVAEELVLERWPRSFEVAQMFSDKWSLGRVFSGQIGDVRMSRVVRYHESFSPPSALPSDEDCAFRFPGSNVPFD